MSSFMNTMLVEEFPIKDGQGFLTNKKLILQYQANKNGVAVDKIMETKTRGCRSTQTNVYDFSYQYVKLSRGYLLNGIEDTLSEIGHSLVRPPEQEKDSNDWLDVVILNKILDNKGIKVKYRQGGDGYIRLNPNDPTREVIVISDEYDYWKEKETKELSNEQARTD